MHNSKRESYLIIKGARQNNLQNIDLYIPHNKLTVITGISGSGKSSLAFDTIYAEGQWRFIECMSSYARVFIEKLPKPDVDLIDNIRPSIALEQRNPVKGSRATVGTHSNIYDYLRILFQNSKTICPKCHIENWKLGDIFRSKPITVGTPSPYFEDIRDANHAFATHRSTHVRASSPYSGRVVLVGANDGQLHAFRTSDGTEAWSFIPPNLLSRLKMIAHNTHPTNLTHQSYVDGPVSVADVWVPETAGSGTAKSASDWQTILLFGEGQGAGTNLWSSSPSCDSGFNQTYTTTYQYYCGYHCLNITSPLNPVLCGPTGSTGKWLRLGLSSSQAYMGAPWSSPMIGRLLVNGNEKWVAFIGGGYSSPGAADSGKGIFVFDLVNGNLLWSFTRANNSSLDNPMPATPAIVDIDNDGFIDTAYLGDIGSNMWRFKFCRATDGTSCGTSNWTGGRLFESNSSSGIRPVFTSASVAKDDIGNIWVYWGTGDKLDPTSPNAQENFSP